MGIDTGASKSEQWADRLRHSTMMRILDVLADRKPHTLAELQPCLWDDTCPPRRVHPHLMNLRRWLRPRGQDITCTIISQGDRRRAYYQLTSLQAIDE